MPNAPCSPAGSASIWQDMSREDLVAECARLDAERRRLAVIDYGGDTLKERQEAEHKALAIGMIRIAAAMGLDLSSSPAQVVAAVVQHMESARR